MHQKWTTVGRYGKWVTQILSQLFRGCIMVTIRISKGGQWLSD
ncbi:Uncharacterised protein [Vibrio cholerae]|nr:Uncharacterised protein [Vibrio cholerae]CSC19974.1 Uncharacterised protein [Vibrio cholerae]CSC99374.1 Uncharacterised protein [Vibrio cholerae]CSD80318.1 Uncharacterised protein [Vibrio cholerae]CSI55903.1 Uncharacterised protein [Vibrio cholerae]